MAEGDTTALLFRARDGSREALDRLYERVAPRLLRIVRLQLGPSLRGRVESRDVLQSCLLRSFERLDQLEGEDAAGLMAWLSAIARNEIRDLADFHRRQRRDMRREVSAESGRMEALEEELRSVVSRIVLDEEARRMEEALESLSEDHRRVIVLRRLEERSWEEIAELLGRSRDACRMLLARALSALTLRLEESEGGVEAGTGTEVEGEAPAAEGAGRG